MTYHSSPGEKITAMMDRKGVSSKELAVRLGMTRQAIYKLRAAKDIRWPTLVNVCKGLDCTLDELVK